MNKPAFLQKQIFLAAGLFLLAAGLPLSKFLTGFSQFVLLFAFLFEGRMPEKLRRLRSHIPALLLIGLWLLHLAGLVYSEDRGAGLWDVRMKLPLLVLALSVGSAARLPGRILHAVLMTFVAAVLAGTCVSTAVLYGFIGPPVNDIRDIFIFHISHIRFALFTCLSISYLVARLSGEGPPLAAAGRIAAAAVVAWLVAFLILAESVTGLGILLVLTPPALVLLGRSRRTGRARMTAYVLAVAWPLGIAAAAVVFIRAESVNHDQRIDTSERTALGHDYEFHLADSSRENGYRIAVYICRDELREAWNARSAFPFDSLDRRSQQLSATLIRYLTSLGWRKDADAVHRMSDSDVRAVEAGIADHRYTGTSNFRGRMMELVWEFRQAQHSRNASGHSATMRMQFLATGWKIFLEHPWTGVGTGDLQRAFDDMYSREGSTLDARWRLRAHNQYLSVAIAFGIFGLLYFLVVLLYPLITERPRTLLLAAFMGILLLSMLTEDTLETPAGASFYALFSLLLPALGKKEH
jgi:hypothetical protein